MNDWSRLQFAFRADMTDNKKTPTLSVRKRPQQTRSKALVAAVLEAAVRVLAEEGAPRFTMARVAEKAGIGVGSLYQYFPNKEAVLFRLQAEEWWRTDDAIRRIFADTALSPPERLRKAIHFFFRSECDEAQFRTALADAVPLYRDTPEAALHKRLTRRKSRAFMQRFRPDLPIEDAAFAADVAATVIAAVGKTVSESKKSPAEVDALAGVVGDMLCAWLERRTFN